MRVTEFRDYLACPYRYYLRHYLQLQTVETTAEELDPATFGTLLHEVLGAFAVGPAAVSHSAAEIRAALHSILDANATVVRSRVAASRADPDGTGALAAGQVR
jgi:RecB family exonuclease